MQRRDFIISLTTAIGMIATACKKPVHKLAPLVIPDELEQTGATVYYNTVYPHYGIPYSIRIKTREGRPIKIDPNPDCMLNNKGTNATIQASIFSLYDPARFVAPTINGKNVILSDALANIKRLIKQKPKDRKILFLGKSINSPLFDKLIEKISNPDIAFLQFPVCNENNIPFSFFESINNAHKKIIISLGADILGSSKYSLMFQNTLFSRNNRKNIHILTAEPYLTQTGMSSDKRELHQIEELEILASLIFHKLNTKNKQYSIPHPIIPTEYEYLYNSSLLNAIRENVDSDIFVFAGEYLSERTQQIINKINGWDYLTVKQQYKKQITLLKELIPETDLVFLLDFNTYYLNSEISALIDTIPRNKRISISQYYDETASNSNIHIPASNYLENWELYNYPEDNKLYIQQPVVSKLNKNSISSPDFLLKIFNPLADSSDYYSFLRKNLKIDENLWVSSLQKGYIHNSYFNYAKTSDKSNNLQTRLFNSYNYSQIINKNNNLQLLTVPSIYHYIGIEPNNPFLLELPHPITKMTWANVVLISKNTAKKYSLKQGDIIKINALNNTIELPVLLCDSCADNLLLSEYGFGNKIKNGLTTNSKNVYELSTNIFNNLIDVKITKTGKTVVLPLANGKQHIELSERKDLNFIQKIKNKKEQNYKPQPTFKNTFEYLETKWEMEIDLSKCTGCNACVVACQIENNIPVTTEKEVIENKAMHWLRINSYIIDIQGDIKGEFEPLMCQHCDNAPCENVCPVGATTHSPEGINEMTYNRCIGSRYCIINCPYEVRVFNFDDYHKNMKSPLELLLNPDVTVRSRGVSEKCTFCVHRIDEYERNKQLGNNPSDVQTACQQACPTSAISFGNILSKNFTINKNGIKLLEGLNTGPSVTYISKFNNID